MTGPQSFRRESFIIGCTWAFFLVAVCFGLVVEIVKGIAWIRWAFG